MFHSILLSVLAATVDVANSSWLPVREWVHGPIPGTSTANIPLRTSDNYDFLDTFLQHLKTNNCHTVVPSSPDLRELVIQFNQDIALNLLTEDIIHRSYCLQTTHSYLPCCLNTPYTSHHGGFGNCDPKTIHHLVNHPIPHPLINTSLDSTILRSSFDPLFGQDSESPQPYQYHFEKESNLERIGAGSRTLHHSTPYQSAFITIPHISSSDASVLTQGVCVDHIPITQGEPALYSSVSIRRIGDQFHGH